MSGDDWSVARMDECWMRRRMDEYCVDERWMRRKSEGWMRGLRAQVRIW